jgi:hypothetical protein
VSVNFAVNVLKNMNELTKPNAFVFKAYIDGEYRLCVCPRVNDKWSEKDIVYVKDDPYKEFDDVLDNKLFSIVFVGYTPDESGNGFNIKNVNSHYIKSDTDIAQDLYMKGQFFNTIEKGYQHFYEQSERQGEQTQTNQ